MQIKKTVGFQTSGYGKRKGYDIHTTCGHKYRAKPVGPQSYECGGANFDTLRAIKAHIEAGGFEDGSSVQPMQDGPDTWDCVHPCAMLILSIDPGSYFRIGGLIKTLDNYGWLDVMGRPDVARAEREIKRVQNLRKSQE